MAQDLASCARATGKRAASAILTHPEYPEGALSMQYRMKLEKASSSSLFESELTEYMQQMGGSFAVAANLTPLNESFHFTYQM